MRLYYGLVEQEAGPFMHQVIGERLGVSRSRVPQLIAQALRALGVAAS